MSWEFELIRAVVGILQKDDVVLIGQRPFGKPYSGYWEFPGGKIEKAETAADALSRELHEELGIRVLQAERWFEYTHHYPDKTVALQFWRILSYEGDPVGKENQTLCWVNFSELQELNLLEGNLAVMDKLKDLFC